MKRIKDISNWRDGIGEVLHGDCLELMKMMPDKCVDLTITSPPYNMRTRIRDGEYTTREKTEHFSKKYANFGDDLSIENYYQFHRRAIIEMLRISSMVFWNIAIVTGSKEAVFQLIGEFRRELKDIIVWDKGSGQPSMHASVLNRGYELILIFEKDASAGRAFSRSYFNRGEMADVWRLGKGGKGEIKGHSALFPTQLATKIILGWSNETDLIFDPFAGSFTTAVAAKQLNRQWIACDISEKYCKIGEDRLRQEVLGI